MQNRSHTTRRAIQFAIFILHFAICNAVRAGEDPKLDPSHAANMAKGLELFKTSVRRVLVDSCLNCHGGEKIKADLDIASREALLKGGKSGIVVIPGAATKSLLYKQIAHLEEPYMPQKKPKLPQEMIDRVAAWIDLGAPYDKPLVDGPAKTGAKLPMVVTEKDKQWWSFLPLKKVQPPAAKSAQIRNWCRTPVDRLIAAKLEEKGIAPNTVADPRTLIRRVYFDLIGVPPPPGDVEAFEKDPTPANYEKIVDNLLANPHFGERWARHWLDVARFGESHGFEQDYDRPYAYYYRDFVIKAFNQDLPYDTFVKWNLAGDEFEPDNPLALTATGFVGAGVFPTQITANEVERTRYDALDDMAATTGTAFLGLTVGCARCHDHKFDPIPANDYYRMLSTFTTTVRSEIELDFKPEIYKEATAKFDAEHQPLVDELSKFEKEELPKHFEEWLKNPPKDDLKVPHWIVLDLEAKSSGGATMAKQADGSILASGTNPDFDTYTFVARTRLKGITAVRIEALSDPSMTKGGPGRASNGNFALTDFKVVADADNIKKGAHEDVKLLNPKSTFEQKGLPVSATIDADKKSAWAIDPQFGKNHAAVFELEKPAGFETGTVFSFTLKFENNKQHNFGRTRVSISTAPNPAALTGDERPQPLVELGSMIGGADIANLTGKQKAELLPVYRTIDPEWKKLSAKVAAHLKKQPKPNLSKVMVCSEGVKAIRHHTQGGDFLKETHFLNRGDTNQKKGVVTQSFLQVLMNAPEQEKKWIENPPGGSRTSYRRRSLANWITDTQYGAGQLAARVMVNRLWQHHLGRGIVATPNDFGFQGDHPTHPELLDWLAAELIGNGWKLKSIHKLILTSAVYMQSSAPSAEALKIDPQNQFFWRAERRRLEAEAIRDSMLAVTGTLDETMFGAGTLDESHKRRSIYFMVKRSKLIPMMQLFDVPEPNVSVGNRSSTTVAPQALLFMNNPNVRGWARNFAKRVAAQSESESVRKAYALAFNRQPAQTELDDALSFLKQQTGRYATAKKQNPAALALEDFCQVVLSMNEFVYVE